MMNMRTFDYSPFYRATVGFDRVFNLLDSVASQSGSNGYPPYNIEKSGRQCLQDRDGRGGLC
jgi:molecular chaperone IbpA